MSSKTKQIQAIPTNIISGFLGVGKTTSILSLLKSKPENERWAVLVNEFGEIGIDGGLFKGQHAESTGVFIREVPGGCMCCTAGLPMRVALNQLLLRARPQRLLIEPTGLGHPKEVLDTLNAEHYQNVLDIQKNVTLVDARKLTDLLYTNHATFNQQIDIADIIVGNKQDLYRNDEKALLKRYISERKGKSSTVIFTDHGNLDPSVLLGPSSVVKTVSKHTNHHHPQQGVSIHELPIPACGYLKVENTGEGYHSIGWRFSPKNIFSRKALFIWFNGLCAERMKAIFITDEGVFGYNVVANTLTETALNECMDSRIEFIVRHIDSKWESQLMDCLTKHAANACEGI